MQRVIEFSPVLVWKLSGTEKIFRAWHTVLINLLGGKSQSKNKCFPGVGAHACNSGICRVEARLCGHDHPDYTTVGYMKLCFNSLCPLSET